MRRVRARIYAALDRKLWPRDQSDLHFLLSCLNGLMAVAANDFGTAAAAEELARRGLVYATVIDHRPLMAAVRQLANIAYWNNEPRQSRRLAAKGLEYLSGGPNAAQLHLHVARAAAKLGDTNAARSAIASAADAREREHRDDLLEIGGEFGFSRASHHYYAGSTLIEISGAEREAVTELEEATGLYSAGPDPGEDHSQHCEMCAHIDLGAGKAP